jgi:hypothetical protein
VTTLPALPRLWRRDRDQQARARRIRGPVTPLAILKRAGRVALWITVLILLARGLDATFSTPPRPTVIVKPVGPGWPDDQARAFAAQFAATYLAHDPKVSVDAYQTRLAELANPEVAQTIAAEVTDDQRPQQVAGATVAGHRLIDRTHALITVAATIQRRGHADIVRITVPVARDQHGALTVNDLPALAPRPANATVPAQAGDPPQLGFRGETDDVLTRYFQAYLAGDTGALRYLSPPGARTGSVGGMRLERLGQVSLAAPRGRDGSQWLLVTITASDPQARARHQLRYRVRLVRAESRWQVAEVLAP